MSEETIGDNFIIMSSHGQNETIQYDYFWNETNVHIDGADFETQALIIPVNLKGLFNYDTERMGTINIIWYDGNQEQHNADFGDAVVHSNFYFYADEANSRYIIIAKSYEDIGTTNDPVTYYIPMSIDNVLLQSQVISESGGVISVQTLVSATPTFSKANGASKGEDFGATDISQVGVGLFTSSLNDNECCVAFGFPYLTEHIDGAQMSDVSDPFPANSRSSGGWTLEPDGTACDWVQLGTDDLDLISIDWTFNLTNRDISTVDTHVTTIDNKLGEIDDDDGEIPWDELKFFAKIKRIHSNITGVLTTLTHSGVRGLIEDIFDNLGDNQDHRGRGVKLFQWFYDTVIDNYLTEHENEMPSEDPFWEVGD